MEVVLLENIRNLGALGDKVTVKAGFGRNYLIPQGKACFATEDNVEKFEARRAELEKAQLQRLSESEQRAAAINALSSINIPVKASDEGKLYGSVGTAEIVHALHEAGVEIEKREVTLPEGAIRSLGEFDIQIQLHTDVTASIHIIVVAES